MFLVLVFLVLCVGAPSGALGPFASAQTPRVDVDEIEKPDESIVTIRNEVLAGYKKLVERTKAYEEIVKTEAEKKQKPGKNKDKD